MIILSTTNLPAGLVWSDEFSAPRVAQTVRYALDGSPVVFYSPITAGIPITLESEADAGWATRAQVEEIAQMAANPGGIYDLMLRGRQYRVMFRHNEPPAFEAEPIINVASPRPTDFYRIKLKLITVE